MTLTTPSSHFGSPTLDRWDPSENSALSRLGAPSIPRPCSCASARSRAVDCVNEAAHASFAPITDGEGLARRALRVNWTGTAADNYRREVTRLSHQLLETENRMRSLVTTTSTEIGGH
ncbi:MAG: hypothetical protein LKI93_02510 [Bifidobacteriaceae bacterium]|jgi:hypothetical protein|nr:hypothetical protein [Bifidobacteriaceae bacterium]MCI1915196.1 hypothetical protein [Bifidobacteriaceae bacterium]